MVVDIMNKKEEVYEILNESILMIDNKAKALRKIFECLEQDAITPEEAITSLKLCLNID